MSKQPNYCWSIDGGATWHGCHDRPESAATESEAQAVFVAARREIDGSKYIEPLEMLRSFQQTFPELPENRYSGPALLRLSDAVRDAFTRWYRAEARLDCDWLPLLETACVYLRGDDGTYMRISQ